MRGTQVTTDNRPDVDSASPTMPPATSRLPIERHPDIPIVGPMAGAFTWDVPADTWVWSDEMYAIHGFAPHEVVPTTELFLSHKHPADREKTQGVIDRFLSTGERFACYHRIVDFRSQERHVLVVAEGTTADDGTVVEMTGFMIDLTITRLNDMEPAITEALDEALVHRNDIEMAKGAIMVGFGTDPDEAFAILRVASNRANLKVREIARRIVSEFSHGDRPSSSSADVQSLVNRVTRADYDPTDRT